MQSIISKKQKQKPKTYRQIRSSYDTVSQKVVKETLLNPESCILTKRFDIYSKTCVKRSLEIDKTKVLMTNGSLMKIESIAECCNTFDLH